MSTIASPRDPPTPLNRRVSHNLGTPTSSGRPSLEVSRSANTSPNPGTAAAFPQIPKRNRAALREYYNIRSKAATSTTPAVEVTDSDQYETSEVPQGEMDREGFDSEVFVKKALAENGMEELLRLYARTLGETRALEAEKKALVYDNYSKLISATETIRKMRANMDPLNPMASTLDPAIAQIYSQASSIREALRKSIQEPDESAKEAEQARQRRARTKQLALEVLETPSRVRVLMNEGRLEDARQAWKKPRKLLLVWKEKGYGGPDVSACIADGDAALRGEPSTFDWRNPDDGGEEEEEEEAEQEEEEA